ncbi:ATP-dependent DNA helicase PIF1 [Phytophthora palmivora]|uniref:ATP-dependent DNA helicase PIF1 n=1 Tax=Phytophthora palmivora TaxID=4796 RepID=A0A2P4YDU3_9STRA|nr:ATP-dependent DNA helicase PIF1 [Phytophthora palmivora]
MLHRHVRSPSSSSSSESPTHASPSTQSPRRASSASAETLAASNGPELTEKQAAVSTEVLHSQVVVFTTSALAAERQQALDRLYNVLVTDQQASDVSDADIKLLNERDTNTLVSVSAQRLRSSFSRALELFNTGRFDGNAHTTFLLATESEERDVVLQMLYVLRTLVVVGDNAQALLLDLRPASASGSASRAMLVMSPEVVQELSESSTLHRIFHLFFPDDNLQMGVLKVLEAMIQGLQPTRWRWMVKQFYEERCLLDLVAHLDLRRDPSGSPWGPVEVEVFLLDLDLDPDHPLFRQQSSS